MKRYLFVILIAVMIEPVGYVDAIQTDESEQEVQTGEKTTAKSLLKEIRSDLISEIKLLAEDYYSASSDEDKRAVVERRREIEKDFVKKAIEVYRGSDDTKLNLKSLREFASRTKGAGRRMLLNAAVDMYSDSNDVLGLLSDLGQREPAPEVDVFFENLQKKSSNEGIKAWAMYYQAQHGIELRELSDGRKRKLEQSYGNAFTKLADSWSGDDAEERILSMLKRSEDAFDGDDADREILTREIAAARASLNLAIGKVAPDIVGEDLDGVEFKLSNYRGKVVMLDFWGDW